MMKLMVVGFFLLGEMLVQVLGVLCSVCLFVQSMTPHLMDAFQKLAPPKLGARF